MRYHGVSIENTHCHQPPSIVTKSIGIYDHFKVLPISQSLLLIFAQAQYLLKFESLCSVVAWWIMIIDSFVSWFTLGPVQFASHTLVHSPWETHLDGQVITTQKVLFYTFNSLCSKHFCVVVLHLYPNWHVKDLAMTSNHICGYF